MATVLEKLHVRPEIQNMQHSSLSLILHSTCMGGMQFGTCKADQPQNQQIVSLLSQTYLN